MEKQMLTNQNQNGTSAIEKETSAFYLFGKRGFDILCGLLGLVLVALVSIVLLPFFSFGRNKGPLFF